MRRNVIFLFFLVLVTPAIALIQSAVTDPVYLANTNGEILTKTNNNSPEILYFGSWSETNDPSFFEKDQHLSNIPYTNCFFTFNKSVVRWIGSKGNDHSYQYGT